MNIIGDSDEIESGMEGLSIDTYCGVLESSGGVRCL